MEAIVYVGHGSRSEAGNIEFMNFITKVRQSIDAPIQEVGFLESAFPTIPMAIDNAIRKGATLVNIMPVLLLPGIHANVDIPKIIETARNKYKKVTFFYGRPLGIDELVVDALLARLPDEKEGTMLLVGHGSRDYEAELVFSELVTLFRNRTGYETYHAVLKGKGPRIADKLDELILEGHQTVYVLPYLLFTGGIMEKIQDEITPITSRYPGVKVTLCEAVGFEPRMELLLQKRIAEAREASNVSYHARFRS